MRVMPRAPYARLTASRHQNGAGTPPLRFACATADQKNSSPVVPTVAV